MLAAQRSIYDIAKKVSLVAVMLSVVFPFALSVIELFVTSHATKTITYILSILSLLFSFFSNKKVKEMKEAAALIQQKFDLYVFDMPWNNSLFGRDKNIEHIIEKYSRKIISVPSKKQKLKNWYTASIDDKEHLAGILSCQRENYIWDVGLRKRYKIAVLTLSFSIISVILILGIVFKETLVDVFARIFFVTPILQWFFGIWEQINEDIDSLSGIDEVINDTSEKQMDDLQQIQRMIYEHRKNCYAIPNLFYQYFKDNDEDLAHRTFSN